MELLQKLNILNYSLNKILIILTCLIITQPTISIAKVFLCTDSDGNAFYTDSPKNNPNCKNPIEKDVKPLPRYNPSSLTKKNTLDVDKSSKLNGLPNLIDNNTYTNVTLLSPTSGETINRCGGVLDISYSLEPSLYSGDNIELYIDGTKHSSASSGNGFTINDLARGSHNISLQITRDGKTVHSSNSVGFTFLRNCVAR